MKTLKHITGQVAAITAIATVGVYVVGLSVSAAVVTVTVASLYYWWTVR